MQAVKHKFHQIIILSFCTLSSVNAKCQRWTDSISKRVDSIIQAKYISDSLNVYAKIYDTNMPEGWFSLLRFDTLTGTIFRGNSYVYRGKNKYLTNYFFFKLFHFLSCAYLTGSAILRNQVLLAFFQFKEPLSNHEFPKHNSAVVSNIKVEYLVKVVTPTYFS